MSRIVALLLFIVCSTGIGAQDKPFMLIVSPDIELIALNENFFIHQSFTNSEQYGRFSSNGLLYVKNGKALMIDTPISNEDTERIYRYLLDSLGVKVTHFIGGHYHNDCIGGMDYLKSVGVNTLLNSNSVKNVISQYGQCKTVVPGHGAHGGVELMHHTITLVEKYNQHENNN
jgi:metallo-beta-lactamase class B